MTVGGALLSVEDIDVSYRAKGLRAKPFHALKNVSLEIAPGETLGLVGESGSGKTTLGRAILGLAPVGSGRVRFDGRDISSLRPRARRALSSDLQVVFQDPYSSLNPGMTIETVLAEPLRAAGATRRDASARIRTLLDQVQLPSDAVRRYPREFSGGQRQRVAIARALALDPKLIVCDEPVSALDLSTQARVLDLFIDIQQQTGVAYLFITHDLSVVRYISHRVAVMLGGRILETGDSETVTTEPSEPYTQKLLLASPVPHPARQAERRRHYESLSATTP
ncbi:MULTISPECIES: ATP-binding cassette domain-containing protein [unclassified Rathayibacter]|uniref:ATP-binding cassette domain-containing protein n=1 Tax=unclassified Rathayibacter TaxID=2609250 RepID=UPI0006FF2ECA|nr:MULTISPECIES: ABC transporter ATP-binding protein [unclassified Rathayibacter]KQQ05607.1 peptide ABC transporter ATP-binding protein [Rathayibacter sp. Leaf294]KQS13468.1 peptide ABC transporter ATP-binding protein [Rathayibacter sp. Leaf185]